MHENTYMDHRVLNILNTTFYQNPCSSRPCFNNGTCQVGYTSKEFRCKCLPGFTGELCEGEGEMSTNEIFSDPSGTARAYVLLFKARINRLENFTKNLWNPIEFRIGSLMWV